LGGNISVIYRSGAPIGATGTQGNYYRDNADSEKKIWMHVPLNSEQQAIPSAENNKKKTTCTAIAAAVKKKAAPSVNAVRDRCDSAYYQSDIGAPGVLLL